MFRAVGCSKTKGDVYIPYRNSLLTSVLQDSLGGNCMTAMIANLSMTSAHLGQAITVCRFAQRLVGGYGRVFAWSRCGGLTQCRRRQWRTL